MPEPFQSREAMSEASETLTASLPGIVLGFGCCFLAPCLHLAALQCSPLFLALLAASSHYSAYCFASLPCLLHLLFLFAHLAIFFQLFFIPALRLFALVSISPLDDFLHVEMCGESS